MLNSPGTVALCLKNNHSKVPQITTDMVSKALEKIKKRKTASPSCLKVEIILAGDNDIIMVVTKM